MRVRTCGLPRGCTVSVVANQRTPSTRSSPNSTSAATPTCARADSRSAIASALGSPPPWCTTRQVILLDEPTSALDPSGVILLRESLLRRVTAGAGVLVSSHHLDEVARIADRITVINDGRAIGTLDPAGVDLERAFFAAVHADDRARSAA